MGNIITADALLLVRKETIIVWKFLFCVGVAIPYATYQIDLIPVSFYIIFVMSEIYTIFFCFVISGSIPRLNSCTDTIST